MLFLTPAPGCLRNEDGMREHEMDAGSLKVFEDPSFLGMT